MEAVWYVDSPIGPLGLIERDGKLTELFFGSAPRPEAELRETELLRRAEAQLFEYFAGERKAFDLPLDPRGTPFQRRVWAALLTIPYGETRSYGEIAALAGSPKGFRAVGMANHQNPISIFIPCHRVIGKNGSLTGYGGGLERKKLLLELERAHTGT